MDAAVLLGLMRLVGLPIIHTIWHMAMERGYDNVRTRFEHRSLRNHDVHQAVRASYKSALNAVDTKFRKTSPSSANRAAGASAVRAERAV